MLLESVGSGFHNFALGVMPLNMIQCLGKGIKVASELTFHREIIQNDPSEPMAPKSHGPLRWKKAAKDLVREMQGQRKKQEKFQA